MEKICEEGMCAGCMACKVVCPQSAITVVVGPDRYNPVISQETCIDCGRCKAVCQQLNKPQMSSPLAWHQGWALDEGIRSTSSSGGFAAAIARGFIEKGGIVYSCVYDEGRFCFKGFTSVEDLGSFSGSKYVKSNPEMIYKDVRDSLRNGLAVLFIGLPCQVAAMRNFIGQKLARLFYSVDLICHGSPSPVVLQRFFESQGKRLSDYKSIAFRRNNKFGIVVPGESTVSAVAMDSYTIAFIYGLSYTNNCYSCDYAQLKRVSDLTLGDSWGSELVDEIPKGISLALCNTTKGEELLHSGNLYLAPVDLEVAIANNEQLRAPSSRPKQWSGFMDDFEANKDFGKSVFKAFPKQCARQCLKTILHKVGLYQ